MRIAALTIAAVLLSAPAVSAEESPLFAPNRKTQKWFERESDLRFSKSGIAKALETPPKDAATARVVASLLAAFAETAPYLHKRDENFLLFASFIAPITSDAFRGDEYLRHMVRRTMLDRRAPESWLVTAKHLKKKYDAPIDLERLRYAVDGPELVDNLQFGITTLLERFHHEVELAPSAGIEKAMHNFKAGHLDRDVAWPALQLLDVTVEKEKGKKSKKVPAADAPLMAILRVPGVDLPQDDLNVMMAKMFPNLPRLGPPPPPVIKVRMKLDPKQYMKDVRLATRTKRYLVKGRLTGFEINASALVPEILIALDYGVLFEDRDLSGYGGFATKADVQACSVCINELM